MDIGRVLANFHIHRQLRGVDIHLQMGKGVVEHPSHPLADLNGAHGEGFVRPLTLHLKAARLTETVAQVRLGGLQNGLLALLAGHSPGDGDEAKDLLAGGIGPGEVAAVPHRLHIDGALAGVDFELAEFLGPAADVRHELGFKAVAVQALEDHLAQLAEDDFVHGVSPYINIVEK